MPGRRLGDLRGGREMDEAVALIDIRSAKRAIGPGRMPRLSLADFIDRRHRLPIRTSQTARPYRPLSIQAIIPIMRWVIRDINAHARAGLANDRPPSPPARAFGPGIGPPSRHHATTLGAPRARPAPAGPRPNGSAGRWRRPARTSKPLWH